MLYDDLLNSLQRVRLIVVPCGPAGWAPNCGLVPHSLREALDALQAESLEFSVPTSVGSVELGEVVGVTVRDVSKYRSNFETAMGVVPADMLKLDCDAC